MSLQNLVLDPIATMRVQGVDFLLRLLGALVVVLVGWAVARLLREVLVRGLKVIQLDTLSGKVGIATVLSRGGLKYTLSELVGTIIYWLLMLVVFMAGLNALNLTIAATVIGSVVTYVPNVVAAIFILVLGLFFANFLSASVRAAAQNAGVTQANLLAQVVQVSVVVFTAVLVLNQLQIAKEILNLSLSIILGSIGLGFAIAFGLGCKDLVGRSVSDFISSFKSTRR